MQRYLDSMMIMAVIYAHVAWDKFEEERGDTNLISIVIVLGIVLALVVVFRGYISKILESINQAVNGFNNDAFEGVK